VESSGTDAHGQQIGNAVPTLSDTPIAALVPGAFVRHPGRPEWGLGQIQSVTGRRVTVNFEGAGKILILADHVSLIAADPGGSAPAR
jgi:hypothetical protein